MNLKYWRDPQKISRRVSREVLVLSDYKLEIHHNKGTSNGRADALSRRPDYDQEEDDNKDITVLPNHLFVRAGQVQELEGKEQVQELTVQDMTRENPVYQQSKDTLKAWIDPQRLKKVEGLWYKDGRRVVTSIASEQHTLIQNHHDLPVYGHPGISRTIHLIERYYLLRLDKTSA